MNKYNLLLIILLTLSACVNSQSDSLEERMLDSSEQSYLWTWIITIEVENISGTYRYIEDVSNKEYYVFSRKLDLSHYLGQISLVKGKFFNDKIEIQDLTIPIIEPLVIDKDPYQFNNKEWWYAFVVDEKQYRAHKGWAKTIIKNMSWLVVMQIYSFEDNHTKSYPLISDNSIPTSIKTMSGEIARNSNGFDMWLENSSGTLIYNLKANYDDDKSMNEQIVNSILESFKEIEKVNIEIIRCWWTGNIICPEWYICQTYDWMDTSAWKCVNIK